MAEVISSIHPPSADLTLQMWVPAADVKYLEGHENGSLFCFQCSFLNFVLYAVPLVSFISCIKSDGLFMRKKAVGRHWKQCNMAWTKGTRIYDKLNKVTELSM